MPIDPSKYPSNWRDIRATILGRAGNRCEGSPAYPDCRAANHQPHPVTGSRVVLTVGHVNHDTSDNRPENLRAWCQRCHLKHDAQLHARNSAVSRQQKAAVEQLHRICKMALKHWDNRAARPTSISAVIAAAEGALRDLGDAK